MSSSAGDSGAGSSRAGSGDASVEATDGRRPGPILKRSILALLCLIWGTTWAAIEVSTEGGIPPWTGIALRFGAAGAVLLVMALVQGVRLGRTARERWLWPVNGLMSFAISYGVVYWAEQHIPPGLTAVLFATYPLIVALLGHLFLPKERLGGREAMFILLSFSGVALIYSEDFGALGGAEARWAALLMIVSPLVSAIGSVAVKRFGSDLHPYSVTAVPMLFTGALFGVAAAVWERDAPKVWSVESVGTLAYLSLFGTVVTFSLYFWLLRHMPVGRLSLVAYVVPMVAVAIGVLRGEPMTPRLLLGAAIVIGGVALTTRAR